MFYGFIINVWLSTAYFYIITIILINFKKYWNNIVVVRYGPLHVRVFIKKPPGHWWRSGWQRLAVCIAISTFTIRTLYANRTKWIQIRIQMCREYSMFTCYLISYIIAVDNYSYNNLFYFQFWLINWWRGWSAWFMIIYYDHMTYIICFSFSQM